MHMTIGSQERRQEMSKFVRVLKKTGFPRCTIMIFDFICGQIE